MALQPAPSAQRAIELIRFFADHPDETFAVAELARRLGQSRATCQAVLLALEASDWVRRTPAGGYALGAGLIAIGAAAQRGVGIVDLLRSAVGALNLETGQEVMGCLPAADQLIVVSRSGPTTPFSAAVTVGQSYPLVPPLGLAYTAWDDAELERWIARAPKLSRRATTRLREAAALVRERHFHITLDPVTRRTLELSLDSLSAARRDVVVHTLAHDEQVYATGRPVTTMRVSHLSSPIFGADQRIVAMLGVIFGPDESEDIDALSTALCSATRRLSAALDGSAPERSA